MSLRNRTFSGVAAAIKALEDECKYSKKRAVDGLSRAIPRSLAPIAEKKMAPAKRAGRVNGISGKFPWMAEAEIERIDRDTGRITMRKINIDPSLTESRRQLPKDPKKRAKAVAHNKRIKRMIVAAAKKKLTPMLPIKTRGIACRVWRILSSAGGSARLNGSDGARRIFHETSNSYEVVIGSMLHYATRATTQADIAIAVNKATHSEIKKFTDRLHKASQAKG